MKRTIIAITMLLLALFGAQAQLPQLTPVKDMKEELHPAFKNGKWGYANNKEKFVITPVFDAAEEFLRVGAADGSVLDVAKIKVGTAWGYLSREGTYFIEPEYFYITEFNMHSVAFALKAGTYTMYGVEPVYNTRFGKYLVKAVVLEKGFNAVPQFSFKGYAVARKDELYGFIDKNGKWLIPNEYDSISRDKDFDMYRLERNGRIGYATYDGNIVFPAEFNSIGWFGPGLVVADNGKAGLFRADGREILPAEFDSIDLFGENVLLGKDGNLGLASMKGKI
ncbi:MAG: WG repeat-containing protein, partial [Bacteroidales bacterium]|nr:WG repeat-containing protein [Bacteroidales bacterium]